MDDVPVETQNASDHNERVSGYNWKQRAVWYIGNIVGAGVGYAIGSLIGDDPIYRFGGLMVGFIIGFLETERRLSGKKRL